MVFNKSRKWDFPPEVSFSDNQNLEVVPDMKLVGVIISEDLKWTKNTQYICQKAMSRMWFLRRMKRVRLDEEHLLDTYIKEIRSILELAVPVWHSGLTFRQSSDIERVQKTALFIILGNNYHSYEVACTLMEIESLDMRREKLCLSFAKRDIKKDKSLFQKTNKSVNTRNKNLVVMPKCNTRRFEKSSIPYLSKLVNNHL